VQDLEKFRLGDIPAHSSIQVTDLPIVPPEYEISASIVNGGDDHEAEFTAFGYAGFRTRSLEQSDPRMRELRRAYVPIVNEGLLPDPIAMPIKWDDGWAHGAGFSIQCYGRHDVVIRDAIEPLLLFFRRLSHPVTRVFICHASEDKPIARELAAYLQSRGIEIWLDELRIKVGDSIVAKINDGVASATHVALLVSTSATSKPWVTREFSAALMRQLADASVRVLPVRLDEANVPAILADIRYADCRTDKVSGFEQVFQAAVATD
jgi:hypothetical protein